MSVVHSDASPVRSRRSLFNGFQLTSVFQPIFGLSHRRAVGYEALLRATDNRQLPVSPLALFDSLSADRTATLELDDTCQALHVHNFAHIAPSNRWLFLNIDPTTIAERRYMDGRLHDALNEMGLPPSMLVIEILEAGIDDESLLQEAVAYFRGIGALVALDDFGSGHSNFDRIWRLAPDIVKLDRSLIVEAGQHRSGRLHRILPNLVALIHEAGALVLAEGVETEEQALIAMDADVDFVQGFYFAEPSARIDRTPLIATTALESLTSRFVETAQVEDRRERQALAPYVDVFRAVADAIARGEPLARTCQSLLRLPRTARCYLLNENGDELVHFSNAPAERSDAGPIANTSGGTWFRRHYFRDAISDPRRHKISRPYLSGTGTNMCITLSIAYPADPQRVFCCDIHC
ncbi:EAL domain-containing protein [Salinisphaera sp. T31B1]|uniref:EAL domain-containing protein n=1 Tax=Salinisphaera sp. T31B1 TaxID=727963 RepID=UPI0033416B74